MRHVSGLAPMNEHLAEVADTFQEAYRVEDVANIRAIMDRLWKESGPGSIPIVLVRDVCDGPDAHTEQVATTQAYIVPRGIRRVVTEPDPQVISGPAERKHIFSETVLLTHEGFFATTAADPEPSVHEHTLLDGCGTVSTRTEITTKGGIVTVHEKDLKPLDELFDPDVAVFVDFVAEELNEDLNAVDWYVRLDQGQLEFIESGHIRCM